MSEMIKVSAISTDTNAMRSRVFESTAQLLIVMTLLGNDLGYYERDGICFSPVVDGGSVNSADPLHKYSGKLISVYNTIGGGRFMQVIVGT